MNIYARRLPLLCIVCVIIAVACSSDEADMLRSADLDTRLSELRISAGTLIPAFDPEAAIYSASGVVENVTITAVCFNPNAKLFINDQEVKQNVGYTVNLRMDSNPIKISVRVGSGSFKKTGTYTLNYSRVSEENSALIGLFPSEGKLNESFYYETLNYTMTVPYSVSSISFTAIAAADERAEITYAYNGAASSSTFNLSSSSPNIITIKVVSADRSGNSTYTVTVTRTPPSSE